MALQNETTTITIKRWYKDVVRALGVASFPLTVLVALIAVGEQVFGNIPSLLSAAKDTPFYLMVSALSMIIAWVWKSVLEVSTIYIMRSGLETGRGTFTPIRHFFKYPLMVRRIVLWGVVEGLSMWALWSFVIDRLSAPEDLNYGIAFFELAMVVIVFLIWVGVSLTTLFIVDRNMPLPKALFYSILTIKKHIKLVTLAYLTLLLVAMGVFMVAVMLASVMPVLALLLIPLPSFIFLLCNMLLHWPIYRDIAGAQNTINLNETPLERL